MDGKLAKFGGKNKLLTSLNLFYHGMCLFKNWNSSFVQTTCEVQDV